MALTLKGLQGTISDTDMATQLGGHHAPTVRSTADYAVTAVNGARTVAIAAGVADSAFLKVTNDGAAAGNLVLAPPASGGKWYAITLDRQWSPTNSATLRADDLAQTDANGTLPTTVPAAVITAAAGLPNQPGTAGSTAGQRQLLALVYVRASDTTLRIFDMRLIRTGAGTLVAATFWAMACAAEAGQLLVGSTITVGQHVMPAGGTHRRSRWSRMSSGYWQLEGRLLVDDTALEPNPTTTWYFYTVAGNSRADIIGIATAGYLAGLALQGQDELQDQRDQAVYRFAMPNGGTVWRIWDTPWIDISTVVGQGGATWQPSGAKRFKTRMAAGVAFLEAYFVVQNTANAQVTLGNMLFGRGDQNAGQPVSSLRFLQNGDGRPFPIWADWASTAVNEQQLTLHSLDTSNGRITPTNGQSVPANWGSGSLFGTLSWSPAA